jgi:hypothetical protein
MPKRAGEINMEDTQWNSLVIEINEYLEADDTLGEGLRQVIGLNLQIGENNPSERESAHGALKALLKGRDGSPLGRKGKKPSVPASVRVAIDRICGVVEEAAVAFFNHDPIIGAVTLARGGKSYDSAEAYASSVTKRTRTALAKAFKTGSWDGEVDSLLAGESDEE